MEEKTEKPSAKRLKRAYQEGDRPKSTDLSQALIFLFALLLMRVLVPALSRSFNTFFTANFSALKDPSLNNLGSSLLPIASLVCLLLIAIFLIALCANLFQTGWIGKKPKSKKRSQRRYVFILLKLGVVCVIGYLALNQEKPSNAIFLLSSYEQSLLIYKKIYAVLLKISIALVLLGFFDFIYQKYKHYKRMHMTKQEQKEERREDEGSKEMKNHMRRQ